MRQFYVYKLIDPRSMDVFYVGKGMGDRIKQHVRDALKGRVHNKPKTERILEIIAEGKQVIEQIVELYDDELEAFAHEIELIATLPNLTNILAGGQGWAMSEAAYAKAQAEKAEKLRQQLWKKHAPFFQRYLNMWDSWRPHYEPCLPCKNGLELARTLERNIRHFVATGELLAPN